METAELSSDTATARLAGFGSRIAGGLIDGVIVLLAAVITFLIWNQLQGLFIDQTSNSSQVIAIIIALLVDFIFRGLMVAGSNKSTIGQRIMGIETTLADGGKVDVGVAVLRYVVSLISYVLILGGYIFAVFSARRQTLHDLAAGTIVTIKNRSNVNDVRSDNGGKVTLESTKINNNSSRNTKLALPALLLITTLLFGGVIAVNNGGLNIGLTTKRDYRVVGCNYCSESTWTHKDPRIGIQQFPENCKPDQSFRRLSVSRDGYQLTWLAQGAEIDMGEAFDDIFCKKSKVIKNSFACRSEKTTAEGNEIRSTTYDGEKTLVREFNERETRGGGSVDRTARYTWTCSIE